MTLTNDQVLDLCRRRNAGIIAASAATNPHAAALADSRSKTNQEGSQPELVVLPRPKRQVGVCDHVGESAQSGSPRAE